MWNVNRFVQPASRGSDEIGIELCQRWSDTKIGEILNNLRFADYTDMVEESPHQLHVQGLADSVHDSS